ncbi:MAG: FAD-binding oxidoreductase [Thermaerobacter sp.]|nr:FAD-binding oxidoreductase [Thermaerobacter sp.]
MTNLVAALKEIMDSDRVSTGTSIRAQHSRDYSYHRPCLPDVVVFPETTEEVSRILALASAERIPVVPFGQGSSLEGHIIPIHGGISLDFGRMNRLIDLQPHDLTVRAQVGMTRGELNRNLGPHGLFFPVDPGADASLGGMAATNAAGSEALRYGAMRRHVLGLEAVVANGTIIHTGGRALKSSAGYDLTGLLVGSEGTLAVITELTLRIYGLPDQVVAVHATLPNLAAVGEVAGELTALLPTATRIELMDSHAIEAVNRIEHTQYPSSPTLLLELSGQQQAAIQGDLDTAQEIIAAIGGTVRAVVWDASGRDRLWSIRHRAALAIMADARTSRHVSTDVAVPLTELVGALDHAQTTLNQWGIRGAMVGHAGDGNFHVMLPLGDFPSDLERARRCQDAIVQYALAHGGTCSGEHGIGMGKISALRQERGAAYSLLIGIKRLWDTNNILNPGKVVAADALNDPLLEGGGFFKEALREKDLPKNP